jgi:phage shock protein C
MYNLGMKRIYRSTDDRKIAGICGGIGEMMNMDPTLIRLVVIFLCLVTAVMPLVLTYIIAWLIIPEKPSGGVQ